MPITVYAARMKYLVVAPLLVAVLVMQGCATTQSNTTYLNVYSNPVGAAIALGDNKPADYGWRQFYFNKSDIPASGCVAVGTLTVVWKSGAKRVINPMKLCEGPDKVYEFTVQRQSDADNLAIDMQFAEAHKRRQQALAAQEKQRQDEASSDAAAALLGAAIIGLSDGLNQRNQNSRTRPTNTSCKSRVNISGNIITDCHSY
jgi:hypothetical protein